MKRFALVLLFCSGVGGGAQEPYVRQRDAAMLGVFAAATVGLFPVDRAFAERLQSPATQESRALRDASAGLNWLASPGAFYIGGALYIGGSLARQSEAADLGKHGLEALVIAEVLTSGLKALGGRARPYVSSTDDPDDWRLGRGWRNSAYRSFPSGHAASAFAAAAVITSEAGRWCGRRCTWLVGIPMYAGAALVGASRMYGNKHWASDVVGGAAIGTLAGLRVVAVAHRD
jgi:membrane-associated phospholipid phosphatase